MLSLLILALSDRAVSSWLLAGVFIAALVMAVLYQRQGERVLQKALSHMLDGATFRPKPH